MKYLNKSQSKKNFKLILNIATPMIIANLSIPLLGLIDIWSNKVSKLAWYDCNFPKK